ncbi:MAG TPA: peptidoglycan DD-metalloendopeptidase family protein [Flavitalea sp.]|nr:peptidoglycan DD-metalloendopeptidase family protein [Flavitalea sp.]
MLKSLSTLIAALLLICTTINAQSRSELERQRSEIQREIEDVKKTLSETKKNRKESLGQLALLQRKLKLREAAINNINKQIISINGNINLSRNEITRLKRELDTLKVQYEKSVVYAYKNRNNYDFLNFIFSAASFNDALKRVEYLKTYRNYREQHAATIKSTQALMQQKISGLEVARKEKDNVLKQEQEEKLVLVSEKKEKDMFVSKLKSREKELTKELVAKTKADNKLRSAIRTAIDRETRLARARELEEIKKKEAARVKAENANAASGNAATAPVAAAPKSETVAAARKSPLEATPEGMIISDNFEKNRGRLPWPVSEGIVKTPFGNYGIEGTKIVGNNPGITIETASGASVKAVFAGDVSSVFDIEGVSVVLVRHGKYFTTYSGLSTVSVAKGQKVDAGQVLGKAGENGEIDFLLLQENKNLNPETWLRRK